MKTILAFIIICLASVVLAQKSQLGPYWLARIKVKCNDVVHNCPGAIISDNGHLITAASCVNKCNDSVRIIKVAVSEYLSSKRLNKRVKANQVTILHDVALVKFGCPKFKLSKVSLKRSCTPKVNLTIINVDKTSLNPLMSKAEMAGRNKKCKKAYVDNWESQYACILASPCGDKSEGLITDEQYNSLYSLSLHASECNKEETMIAALELCEYRKWITNETTTGG